MNFPLVSKSVTSFVYGVVVKNSRSLSHLLMSFLIVRFVVAVTNSVGRIN